MKKNLIVFTVFLFSIQVAAAQSKIKKIALGMHTTCIIDGANKLKCWGSNSTKPGEYFLPNSAPEIIDVFPAVADITIAISFSCALSTAGEVSCWGKIPGATDSEQRAEAMPTKIKLPSAAKAITGITDAACALLTTGKVLCFGRNNWATPTTYSGTNEPLPINLPDDVVQIEADPLNFTALTSDGSIWRWGNFQPKAKKLNLSSVRKILGGDTYLCFAMDSGAVQCEYQKEVFKPIKGLEANVVNGTTHEESGCAVLNDGQVKCWGFNGDGKIGLSAAIDRSPDAHLIIGVRDAVATVMDNGLACALLKNETVKCWGAGFKILGNGDETHLPPYELKIP